MTDTQPPTCGHPAGLPDSLEPCGATATDTVDTGTETYPVCPTHLPAAMAEGWSHVGSLTGGTTYGDDSDYRGDVRNAIERALAATPKDARTVEAKAEWLHEHIERAGWVLTHPEPGETPVMLVPGQQVVEVPDGHTVEVVPTTPTYSYADNELDTLAGIVARLEGLDPESRERAAGFVTHRYGPTAPAVSPWAALSGWDPSRLDRARVRGTYSTDLPGADGG